MSAKKKIGTQAIRICHDCKERRECVWDICPYAVEVHNETDPNEALWLCFDCSGVRADDV